MIARILRVMARDLVDITRENILVYVVVVPLVFAIGLRLFAPSLGSTLVTVVVDPSVDEGAVEWLETRFRVDRVEDFDSLRSRVMEFDDAPGILVRDGSPMLLVEGNEEEYVVMAAAAGLSALRGESAPPPEVNWVQSGSGRSLIAEYGSIFLVIMCLTIGGFVMGLGIVGDREERSIDALAVTPLRLEEYLVGRAVTGSMVALILGYSVLLIVLGPANVDALRVLPALLASTSLAILFGYLLGTFSSNQLGAIAFTKALALPYTMVPLAGMLLPDRLHRFLYPFPNYWSFEALRRSILDVDASVWPPALLTLFAGGILVAIVWHRTRAQLRT